MIDRAQLYSLKKPTHWFWRAGFTREEVLQRLEDERIAGNWLICPPGETDKAVTVEGFTADATVFEDMDRSEQTGAGDREIDAPAFSLDDPSPLLVPVCFLGLFNCLTPAMLDGGNFIMPVIALGVIFGQVGLVATWGVFSSADFGRRLGISAILGLVLYGCLALGILAVSRAEPQVGLVLLFGLMLCPLVLFAVQLPLWAARIWLRFEIAKPNEPRRGSYLRPTRIQDLIMSTAAVGVALALVRMAPAVFPAQKPPEDEFVMFVAIMTGGAAVASLVGILPLAYFTLAAHYTAAVMLGLAVWIGITAVTLVTIVARITPLTPGALEACLLASGSFATVMSVGLLVTRHLGYRLRRRGRG